MAKMMLSSPLDSFEIVRLFKLEGNICIATQACESMLLILKIKILLVLKSKHCCQLQSRMTTLIMAIHSVVEIESSVTKMSTCLAVDSIIILWLETTSSSDIIHIIVRKKPHPLPEFFPQPLSQKEGLKLED